MVLSTCEHLLIMFAGTGGEEGPNPTTRSNIAIIIGMCFVMYIPSTTHHQLHPLCVCVCMCVHYVGPVGAVLVVIILVVLIIILIIIYFYEMKKRSYSFKVRRNKTPHSEIMITLTQSHTLNTKQTTHMHSCIYAHMGLARINFVERNFIMHHFTHYLSRDKSNISNCVFGSHSWPQNDL